FSNWERLVQALNDTGLRASRKESVYKNLNDYGFVRLSDSRRRIPDSDGLLWCHYTHQSFRQGWPELLGGIKRKYVRKPY
ncbi:hypothetical protein GGI11_007539, partial [Coemansia sp. RSA 2049]